MRCKDATNIYLAQLSLSSKPRELDVKPGTARNSTELSPKEPNVILIRCSTTSDELPAVLSAQFLPLLTNCRRFLDIAASPSVVTQSRFLVLKFWLRDSEEEVFARTD